MGLEYKAKIGWFFTRHVMLIPDVFERFPACVPKKGVLHVGACQCEEQGLYEAVGVGKEDVLWIEANEDLVKQLRGEGGKHLHLIHAVVDEIDDHECDFQITNNGSASSSLLNLKTHLTEHPNVHVVERRRVRTVSLNTLFEKHRIPYDRYDFINLDIQGVELRALRGATHILPHVHAIYTEVNIRELYEGCAMMHEIDAFLADYGFQREATEMTSHGWGDALYVRSLLSQP